ncbi:MAG: amidase [Betaproteobacteria bacterium]
MTQHAITATDVLRQAERVGWTLSDTRAAEIAELAAPAYAALARAATRLDFDVDTHSLLPALAQNRAASPPPGGPIPAAPATGMASTLQASLVEAARALREGRVTSVALTTAAIAAAKATQARLNAFVRLDEATALAQARQCDEDLARGQLRGPLHGVPLAHKDMFYRQGLVSSCGSKIRQHWVAPSTACVLERLDAAGAVQIGTLNMTEFAYGPTGQNAFLGDARNPWNTDYITGGSSSGSGAAVAARVVYGALGSDTAGSVRLPAAICGLVGMKTTFGLVSRAGAMPLSQSLDTVGPLTRTVADNALLLSVLAGHDPRDPSTAAGLAPDFSQQLQGPVHGLRIGIPKGYFDRGVEPEVAACLARASAVLAGLGLSIVEVEMPDLDAVNAVGLMLTWGDVLTIHGPWMRDCPEQYTPQTRGRIQGTLAVTAQAYANAQRLRGPLLHEFCARVFSQCDAVLAPVLPFEVPRLSEVDVSGGANTQRILNEITRLMRPVNVLGLPALTVPGGATANGLPCGLQLIGRPFSEAMLYRIGQGYEKATGFPDWAPPAPTQAG